MGQKVKPAKYRTPDGQVITPERDPDGLMAWEEKVKALEEKIKLQKEESDKSFHKLSKQHEELKSELEKINKDVGLKFGNKNNLNHKIDELNQETETLIDEIEKWQT